MPLPAPHHPRPCGPHREIERCLWAAVLDLDGATAVGRRLATRPAPTALEAHDQLAALLTGAEALAGVMRACSGDLGALAVMQPAHGAGGTYMDGPALEAARAVDSAARLLTLLNGTLGQALATMAAMADAPPLPSWRGGPAPAPQHRPARLVAVIA